MPHSHFVYSGICRTQDCTGCGACLNVCSTNAIRLTEDEWGELHPDVDSKKCTACGRCREVCPNNKGMEFHVPGNCYASWMLDKLNRAECASGGLGTALSEYVITEKGGVVFATAYDSDMTPRIMWTDTMSGLQRFKGSKYVQSVVGVATLRKVREFLKQGRYVLFIGTPCQVSGLISFIGRKYDNLLTIDLLCHGVSPVSYFHGELDFLSKKYKIKKVENVRFRGNDKACRSNGILRRFLRRDDSTNFRFTIWDSDGKGDVRLRYGGNQWENYYLAGFLKGITLRENCYSCIYARPERVGDITLGDFIGLGECIPFDYLEKNISVVLTNTEKGEEIYRKAIDANGKIISITRPYAERLSYPYSIKSPFPRHQQRDAFRMLYRQIGYRKAIVRILRKTLFWERLIIHLSSCKRFLKEFVIMSYKTKEM